MSYQIRLFFLLVLFAALADKYSFAQDSLFQNDAQQDTSEETEEFIPSIADTLFMNQQEELQQQYRQQTIEEHSFNNETWKKATEGLDYSDKRKKK
ncbi:MAG: hypothetical protein ABIO46_16065, partial [Chitinophagales bacterium]